MDDYKERGREGIQQRLMKKDPFWFIICPRDLVSSSWTPMANSPLCVALWSHRATTIITICSPVPFVFTPFQSPLSCISPSFFSLFVSLLLSLFLSLSRTPFKWHKKMARKQKQKQKNTENTRACPLNLFGARPSKKNKKTRYEALCYFPSHLPSLSLSLSHTHTFLIRTPISPPFNAPLHPTPHAFFLSIELYIVFFLFGPWVCLLSIFHFPFRYASLGLDDGTHSLPRPSVSF